MENINMVFIGHVDHGKSTLIGRLLYETDSLPEGKVEEIQQICESLGKEMEFGYILDSFEEERNQGITIDTTQIFFTTDKRRYTIIDAPGHVEFIKNMVTGASQADVAVLLIDADEGVREQTKRHSYLISLLGIKNVIVAINKMDKVDYSKKIFSEVSNEIKEFLEKINISPLKIIPISAKNGDNINKISEKMDWYTDVSFINSLDDLKLKQNVSERPLRFAIQDVYNFFEERIYAGRIESGKMNNNMKVRILPSKEETNIKSIIKFDENVENAIEEECVGIKINDKKFLDRGSILVDDSKEPVKEFKATLFWLGDYQDKRYLLKCSTQEVMCEIVKIDKIMDSSTLKEKNELRKNDVTEVVIKTDKPIVVEDFNFIETLGRLVLEKNNVCAGGIVTGV